MTLKAALESSAMLDRGGKPAVRDLLSSLVFNPVDGTIRLNGDRLVMQRAAVGAELRRELVQLLGPAEARVFLLRLGFRCGQTDARFVRRGWPGLDLGDAFTAGTRLHMFSGVVRVETVHNDFDFRRKRFSGEFLWHDSVEGADFRTGHQPMAEPVCWTQTGYASGYASEFFDTLIVYKETECCAQGHRSCRVQGKPADMWPAGDPEVQLFRERIAVAGSSTARAQADSDPARRLPLARVELSDFDRTLLAPVQDALDRLAGKAVPVLIWGPQGTGRFRAAQYLHRKSGKPAAGLCRVSGAEIGVDILTEIAAGGGRKGRKGAPGTVVIDGVEDVPARLQRSLAIAVEEGLLGDGPRVVALSRIAPGDLAGPVEKSLVFGLSAAAVAMPPLSARGDDVTHIARTLMPILTARLGQSPRDLSSDAADRIIGWTWPGNVPELRAVLSAALIESEQEGGALSGKAIDAARQALSISESELSVPGTSEWIDKALDGDGFSLAAIEDEICARAVSKAGGNLSAAARLLGLTRAQLAYRRQQSLTGRSRT